MSKKIEIEGEIIVDIRQYCELNNITDVNGFCENLLRDNFLRIKWGEKGDIHVAKNEELKKEIKVDNRNKDFYGEQ